MVEAKLTKVIIDEKKQEQLIVLQEKNGSRTVPIVIGINEALAIRMKLNKIDPPRPLTHDFICQVLDKLKIKISKVVIDDLKEGVFHAKIYLIDSSNTTTVVDARPSDSIAVAVRTGSVIFIEEKVFASTS